MEFGLLAGLVFAASLAAVEFSYALFQWNSATKAVQLGARLAAVSDPVSSDLKSLTGLESGADPGDPMPHFERVCDGKTESCSNGGTYDAAAMNTLVYGRGGTDCQGEQANPFPGMCDILRQVRPRNVKVTYVHTGLGFAGRPGGPVPTVIVELQDLTFDFVILDRMMGFSAIDLPPFRTTMTGEDLATTH